MFSLRGDWRAVLALACVALGAACTTAPIVPTDVRGALYSAEGRMSVVVAEGDGIPKSSNGRFSWVERAGHSEIALYSPFGETVAQIDVREYGATMRTPSGVEYAPTPEALMQRVVGVALPVAGLRDWMRGRMRAGAARAPQAFDEDGWHVSYPKMADDGISPRVVRLERSTPNAVDVRIVIERWEDAPAGATAQAPAQAS